jgi:cytidylate kinase
MSFQIAIDGPVAAGKGTVAKLVGQRLGLLYIDTGAMYRVSVLLATRHGVPVELAHEDEIVALIEPAEIVLRAPTEEERDGRLSTVLVNGEDVSWEIRTEDVSALAAIVAALPKVRAALVRKQQAIAANQDVIMEGRDITYRVLPEAQLKIYLTADANSRAQRRLQDLQRRGTDIQYDTVFADLEARDAHDMGREHDPLKIIDEAWVLDTTSMTIEEAVDAIVAKAEQLR